jgi:hypothetical protein
VIGVGYGALKLTNHGLEEVQHSASALMQLKASSEKLLQVRLALGSYETLFSVGKQTDDLLPAAHKALDESTAAFRSCAGGPFASDEEKQLAQAVEQARAALVDRAIEPEVTSHRPEGRCFSLCAETFCFIADRRWTCLG